MLRILIITMLVLPSFTYAKTFVVTGAIAGIGLEISKTLAHDGHNLILISINKDKLKSLKKHFIKTYNVNIEYIANDYNDHSMKGVKYYLLKEDVSIDGLLGQL